MTSHLQPDAIHRRRRHVVLDEEYFPDELIGVHQRPRPRRLQLGRSERRASHLSWSHPNRRGLRGIARTTARTSATGSAADMVSRQRANMEILITGGLSHRPQKCPQGASSAARLARWGSFVAAAAAAVVRPVGGGSAVREAELVPPKTARSRLAPPMPAPVIETLKAPDRRQGEERERSGTHAGAGRGRQDHQPAETEPEAHLGEPRQVLAEEETRERASQTGTVATKMAARPLDTNCS